MGGAWQAQIPFDAVNNAQEVLQSELRSHVIKSWGGKQGATFQKNVKLL